MALDKLKTIDDADVVGKRVLVRADLNVPMQNGVISDATRIERFLPTVRELTKRGARVVIMTHFGRPGGQVDPSLSLAPVAEKVAELLPDTKVSFAPDCIGEQAETVVAALSNGDVCVLENLRFHKGETDNDPAFVAELVALGDLYVSDAFSTSHRAHASTEGIARHLPAFAGPLMMLEVNALKAALEAPKRPVAAVVGGAKVSTKIQLLTNLVNKVDMVIVGGGMANTFLFAQGVQVGKSLCEPDYIDTVENILGRAAESGCKIVLPTDVVVASEFAEGAANEVVDVNAVPEDKMILDAGPQSVAGLVEKLSGCKTLVWNGPLGAFEISPFGEGTFALARAAAQATIEGQLTTIAGGGDTVAALNAANVTSDFTYVSTAGGAFLEWLEGRALPGVVALTRD
ncbi:MAG: phosphoglycerate kinase [Rhizobiales bacterium]|nr:phosphoglycerate kinase [Hyphomicrobiales bacterium]